MIIAVICSARYTLYDDWFAKHMPRYRRVTIFTAPLYCGLIAVVASASSISATLMLYASIATTSYPSLLLIPAANCCHGHAPLAPLPLAISLKSVACLAALLAFCHDCRDHCLCRAGWPSLLLAMRFSLLEVLPLTYSRSFIIPLSHATYSGKLHQRRFR